MRFSRIRFYEVLVAGLMCLAVGCGAGDRGEGNFASVPAAEMAAPSDASETPSDEIEPVPMESFDSVATDDSSFDSLPPIPDVAANKPVVEDEPPIIEPLPEDSPEPSTVGGATIGANRGRSTTGRGTSRPRIKGGTFPSPRNWQPPGVSYSSKSKPPVVINTVETLADVESEPSPEEIPVIEPLNVEPVMNLESTEVSPINRVDQLVRKLKSGNIAYNAPESMHYKETRVIELLLSPKESPELLEAQLVDRMDAVSEKVQYVASRMEANLSGTGFVIEPMDPDIQLISSLRPTQWRWRVTPSSYGPQNLNLKLNAHIDLEGGAVYKIDSLDSVIHVEITVAEQVTEYVTANWQWLWGTLILPIVGYRMRGRRKRRRDDWDDHGTYDDRDRVAA